MNRPIPNTLSIFVYLHCGRCIAERPKDRSAREWAQLEMGSTALGFQVWCKRHAINVMHVDFEGQVHPANLTAFVPEESEPQPQPTVRP